MKAFNAIFKSEFRLCVRDMNIPVFGIAFPVIVAVVIGLVMGGGPAFEGAAYSGIAQSFGAFSAISICATGLMGMPLQLADYRAKKVLKRYMVTPVSPAMLLLVQFAINFIMSLISLGSLFGICGLFWGYRMPGNVGLFLLCFLFVTLAIYSLGMMLASIAPDAKRADLLCTLVYFPMLFFSGATIPYEIMPKAAQAVMDILPLTQGIKLMKAASLNMQLESVWIPVLVLVFVTVVGVALSIRFFRWE